MKYIHFLWPVAFLYATSCSVGPAYVPPMVYTPNEWKNQDTCSNSCTQLVYLDHWWEIFHDGKLDTLEECAVANNRELFIAYERIQEARDIAGMAASNFYPQLTLNPLYTNTGELIKNYRNPNVDKLLPNNIPVNTTPFRAHELFYSLPFNLSYEVDLWGQVRDQYQAAVYNWEAVAKDYEAIMLGLTTDLAIAYFQLRTADAQLDLLERVLQTRQKAYDINKARYDEQIILYADVTLAAEEVNIVLNDYQQVRRTREMLVNQIAVLVGTPASELCLEHMPLENVPPPCVPAGVPSTVLLRRPDIMAAEFSVRSEHALVKEAYTQFFPSLTLTATGGFESPTLRDFLRWISRYWMISAASDQVVFDGFETIYNYRAEIARFQQASGQYQQRVLVAFQDVEDALISIDTYAKQHEITLDTTKWAKKTYELYLDRYKLGVAYYIDVANTERDLLNFEISLNAYAGFRYVSTIQLIKALGGGW